MAINKKLIHFKTKQKFNEELANGNILDTSIVFIQDSKQIYTHGQYYGDLSECLTKYPQEFTKEEKDQMLENLGYYAVEWDGVSETIELSDEEYRKVSSATNVMLVVFGVMYLLPTIKSNEIYVYNFIEENIISIFSLNTYTNPMAITYFPVLIPKTTSDLKNDSNYIQDDAVSDGVYAVDADGKLIDYNLADSTALGVALVAGEHAFMIAKSNATDGTNTILYWGKNLYQKDVAGITNTSGSGYIGEGKTYGTDFTTWSTGPVVDFNGAANTAAIIAGYAEHGVSMDARDMCTVLNTFNSSDSYNDWYVPAAGQLALMYLAKTDINAALANISGTALESYGYWSSSEYDADFAWSVGFLNGDVNYNLKRDSRRVRFIRDISVKPLKERVSDLEDNIPTKLSQLENDVPYALKSDVEVEVKVENGVYIVDLNGTLHDPNTFTGTADQVTGIGLVTDNGSWIVALDEWYSTSESTAWNGNIRSAWGGYYKTVTGCWIGTSGHLNDFDGEANTDAIIAQLKDTTDSYSKYYTGAPAAEYCRAYSKGYKDVGSWYLPAVGELNEIVLNKDAINAILTKLGKNNLSKNSYTWSSSQSNSSDAWDYRWSTSTWGSGSKSGDSGVRPICKLELKKPLKERIKDLESQIGDINAALDYIINGPKLITFTINSVECQAEEGMTWREWIFSKYYNKDISLCINPSDTGTIQEQLNSTSEAVHLVTGSGMSYTPNIISNEVIINNQVYNVVANEGQ